MSRPSVVAYHHLDHRHKPLICPVATHSFVLVELTLQLDQLMRQCEGGKT